MNLLYWVRPQRARAMLRIAKPLEGPETFHFMDIAARRPDDYFAVHNRLCTIFAVAIM
jgi:hypothetical protein